jgi:hypothetical protein
MVGKVNNMHDLYKFQNNLNSQQEHIWHKKIGRESNIVGRFQHPFIQIYLNTNSNKIVFKGHCKLSKFK